MLRNRKIIIGTRGSRLSLAQTEHFRDELLLAYPEVKSEQLIIKIIKTSGDKFKTENLGMMGGKGLFVKELEECLLERSIDVAVQLGIDAKKSDQVVRGAVVLPAGTGKHVRVAVFAKGEKAEQAIAAGADTVMMGGMLAGVDETPGEKVLFEGRSFKVYRGMGSIGAMKQGSKDRYFQDMEDDIAKLVPEGVEGRVEYKGSVSKIIYQLQGGLRSSMGYIGARKLSEITKKSNLIKITKAGFYESMVHSVEMTQKTINFKL